MTTTKRVGIAAKTTRAARGSDTWWSVSGVSINGIEFYSIKSFTHGRLSYIRSISKQQPYARNGTTYV